MSNWDFCLSSMVVKNTPPSEAGKTFDMNGWDYSSQPSIPYQLKFTVTLHGMTWYTQSGGLYDDAINPLKNARRLEQFIQAHGTWRTFTFPHPHLGSIICRFENLPEVPEGLPNSGGLVGAFELRLVHDNPTLATPPAAADWDFCPNLLVVKNKPPAETEKSIDAGGWNYGSKAASDPYTLKFAVKIYGMTWYLQSSDLYDETTNPTRNARRFEKFVQANGLWRSFSFPHPHLGAIPVRFNALPSIPEGLPNTNGLIDAFEVELIQHNPAYGADAPDAPTNSALPVVSGSLPVGSTLSTTNGTWTNTPTGYAYQWLRGGVIIPGATSSTYVTVLADVGQNMSCRVTATNARGSASATSATVGPVTAAVPVNTVAPAISGTVTQGQTLSVSTGTWTNSPTSYTYQWKRGGSNIGGATSATYLLASADVGQNITCTVVASNAQGPGTGATSASVGPILPILSLDFVGASYKAQSVNYGSTLSSVPGYAFTRSGTQGAVDSGMTNGVTWFTANTPAITATYGYHSYDALTNNVLNSGAIDNASWTKENVTVTADTTAAPDGSGSVADTIVESTDGAVTSHGVRRNSSNHNAGDTVAYLVKAATRGFFRLDSQNSNASRLVFDLSAGTIVNTGGVTNGNFVNPFIIPAGSGWYLCGATVGSAPGVPATIRAKTAAASSGDTYIGTGANALYMWQGQWYVGSNHVGGSALVASGGSSGSIGASVMSVTMPNGSYTATYTFDDNSTQDVAVTVAAGAFTLHSHPSTLTRPMVKKVTLK